MNVVLMLAHAIEEHDQVKLLTGLGYDVFSFRDPTQGFDGMRPALDAPAHQDLLDACHAKRAEHEEQGHNAMNTPDGLRDPIDWAKADLPDAVLDWADVIICHHFEHTWIVPQWPRLRDKRVIWRTVGQSVEHNERMMAPLRAEGLQIVRYSPKEANIPGYAGADDLIRFYADPDEWHSWTGEEPYVINVTQNLRQRDPYTNWAFWDAATQGLPRLPLGPGSEAIGGLGSLPYESMKRWLRAGRCYLYTGTQPASYTLGLIEALMTGIPVVSIGAKHMGVFPYGPDLFEGADLAPLAFDDPQAAKRALDGFLGNQDIAAVWSDEQRARTVAMFGKATIAAQWTQFLGVPVREAVLV